MDEMKRVVKCQCGAEEYYGMMHWKSGHTYCRHCIESIWRDEGWQKDKPYSPAFDFYFPRYSDGVDYTKKERGK